MSAGARSNRWGMFGVVFAFLALLAVLLGPSIHEAIFPKPKVEDRIAETVVRVRDRVMARLKGAPPAEERSALRLNSEKLPYSISLALAGLAIIGGCVSYLRREDHRYAYVACGVSTLTLAWHAVLLAVGALIVCVVVVAVLSTLDIS